MATLSEEELDGIYAFAVDLGKRAGQMLTDAAQTRIDGGHATVEQKEHVQKGNAVDLVTETDEGKYVFELCWTHRTLLTFRRASISHLQLADQPQT
jgi:myo-inositol-1(or 4)-monophosphatase